MNLSELITTLPLQPEPGQRWAVLGQEAEAFAARLKIRLEAILPQPEAITPAFDHFLLAGALSAEAEPVAWLKRLGQALPEGATLAVIDWQGDGPLDQGPDLERRFKRGKLYRLLRQAGFGRLETLVNHPVYYLIWAVKEPPAPLPQAGQFVTVATLDELPKNGMKQVELFGRRLIVANTGREIVAFAQACPHAGTALIKGKLRGRHIICPLHYYMWDVCTGEPIEPADEDTLPLYPVKVNLETGVVQVALAL
jgi:nitrite reductase/ring-hydroxylating ferredoxin subunit